MSKGIKKAIQQLDTEIAYHCLMNDIEPRSSYIELGNQIERASTKEDLFYIYGRLEAFAEGYNLKVEPLKFHKKKDEKSFWGDYGEERAGKIVVACIRSMVIIWVISWITLFLIGSIEPNGEEYKTGDEYSIYLIWGGVDIVFGFILIFIIGALGGDAFYDYLKRRYDRKRTKPSRHTQMSVTNYAIASEVELMIDRRSAANA